MDYQLPYVVELGLCYLSGLSSCQHFQADLECPRANMHVSRCRLDSYLRYLPHTFLPHGPATGHARYAPQTVTITTAINAYLRYLISALSLHSEARYDVPRELIERAKPKP